MAKVDETVDNGHMEGASDRRDQEFLVRAAFRAVSDRDFGGLLAICTSDVEFASVLAASEGRAYRGATGLRAYLEDLGHAWAEFDAEPIEFLDGRDGPVTIVRSLGRGRTSAVPVALRTAVLWTLRGNRIARGVAYLDVAEALSAAGIERERVVGPRALLNVNGT